MDEIKDLATHILKVLKIYREKQIITIKVAIEQAEEEIGHGTRFEVYDLLFILINEAPNSAQQWAEKVLENYPDEYNLS